MRDRDVVGGAVKDTGDGQDLVAHQVVLERAFTMGDTAAQLASHLICTPHAPPSRRASRHDGQQGLVGRDDVLAVLEGGGEDLGRGVLAADELDDDIDGGSVTTSCQSLVKASRSMPAASACSQQARRRGSA